MLNSTMSNKPTTDRKKRKSFSLVGFIVAVVGIALIFASGVAVGQGRISIIPNQTKQVATDAPDNLNYTSVEKVYDVLRANYDGQVDNTKILDGIKQGLAQATGDPYTEYFNVADAKDFSSQLNGTFSGIGAELGKDENGNVIVISPLAGYPAEKAGLKARDLIATVDNATTSGLSVDQVVKKIRGEAGTKVTLKIVRGGTQALTLEITREEIKIPSVESSVIEGNIGYLRITRFGDDTVSLATKAANDFKQANVKGIILDMRSDPGGLLDAAVRVSSLWLSPDQIVLQEKRDGKVTKTFRAIGAPVLKDVKTIVLLNEGSASASEITAGALRDNKAATIMGTKSYGKGSVQGLQDLGDGSVLKVTVARWFTPSGKGIDKTGIEPDKEVKISDDDAKNNRDPQKQAAIDAIK